MKNTHIIFIITLLLATMLMNCKKDKNVYDQSAQLSFSNDTILFDTIFVTVGSTTKLFKIYNTSKKRLRVSNIALGQGTASQYRINVDGIAGVNFQDIEIPPKDSLFIFVEVTIDPTNGNLPFLVADKITFLTNGKSQEVVLNAFGKDAYFHTKEIITADVTWATDKPHFIYSYCAVDSAITLTIPGGAKVHAYNKSMLYVYKGSLITQGTFGNEVEFLQSRSEDFQLAPVDSVGGQWRGIYFFAPRNSKLEYTKMSNATIGIQVDTLRGTDSVILENVSINNSSFASIVTQGGNVYANSCLFGSAGEYSAFLSIGGSLFFDHCTFANYWAAQRSNALFALKDYYTTDNAIVYRPFTKAVFKNSIIYGNNDSEFAIDTLSRTQALVVPNFQLINCDIKTEDGVGDATFFTSCWKNEDPAFRNTSSWEFQTDNSPAVDGRGTTTNPISDLDGNGRSASGNDLGCYNN